MESNPYATGGGGSDFERRVAAACVCSAIAGVPVPPFSESATTIWLQAAHLGCLIDDVVLELRLTNGSKPRVYISVKSAINPRASDPQFSETISKAWDQWQAGNCFDRSGDRFLLAAAVSRSPRIYLFGRLTETARAASTGADFEHRLSLEGYHNAAVRQLLPEVAAIVERLPATITLSVAPNGSSKGRRPLVNKAQSSRLAWFGASTLFRASTAPSQRRHIAGK